MDKKRLANLPGAEIILKGLSDLSSGRVSEEACAVLMAKSRLRALGLSIPSTPVQDPERKLYELLQSKYDNGAHSKFKAYERRLHSFLRAAGY